MSENIKAFIKIHIVIYLCLLVSIFGIYIIDAVIAKFLFSIITTVLPLSLLICIFYVAYKESKNA